MVVIHHPTMRSSRLPIATTPHTSTLRLEHSPLLLFSNSISSYQRTTIERNVDEPLESSGLGVV
jgi:hypothetical protein